MTRKVTTNAFMPCEIAQQLSHAMESNGYPLQGMPVYDGEIHRFHVKGDKKGTLNGWYVLFLAPIPAAVYGSWKTQEKFNITSLQFISPNGSKWFQRGGRVSGCFHLIGVISDILYICEGYATGATIHQETGLPVAVAFFADNLKLPPLLSENNTQICISSLLLTMIDSPLETLVYQKEEKPLMRRGQALFIRYFPKAKQVPTSMI